MLRRELLRALMSLPLAAWLRPRAFGGLSSETGPNAADAYRRAFGWAAGLKTDDVERLRECATMGLDDPRVIDLIRQARPALEAIHEGAAIGDCRWGPDIVSSDELNKGHLDAANLKVIRVACLSARRHARSGQAREALDDLFAALALAHRVGTGGFLFARILEFAGESAAFNVLGRILPTLGSAGLDDLSRRLDTLPPPEPASAAIGPESRFILGSIRIELRAIGPAIGDTDWDELGLKDDAEVLKTLTHGDPAKLLEHLESTVPAFAELARRLDLPRSEYRAALEEFARAERPIHPIAADLVDSAWGVRHNVDRMLALRAMLRAGVVLIRDGEPAFRAIPDPYGPGGFGLERRGEGFLIRSALHDKEMPEASLRIGLAG